MPLIIAMALLTAACASEGDDAQENTTDDADGAERYEGDDFYAVPDPLPGAQPGDLIRYEELGADELGGEARSYRVMYRSRSLDGEAIAVTGSARVPEAGAPSDGRPVVTVAHPTSGVADACAPSKDAGGDDPLTTMLIDDGYAVVTSDYQGLGPPGRHPYLVGRSEGRSVLDAARAVRQLPDSGANNEVGIFGFSQGGHAAIWAGQIADRWAPELDLAGIVAAAPESEPDRVVQRAGENPRLAYLLVAGFAATYEELTPDQVLTGPGRVRFDSVTASCSGRGLRAVEQRLFKADAFTGDPWNARLDENVPGTRRSETPTLILHSAQDAVIPPEDSAVLTDRLCETGWKVERRVFPEGGDHIQSAIVMFVDGARWLDERTVGKRTTGSTCGG